MNMFLSRELLRRLFGLIVCAASCAGLIFSASAHAAMVCTIASSVREITFAPLTVPRDALVGTPIGTPATSAGKWSCPPNPPPPKIPGSAASDRGGFNLGFVKLLTLTQSTTVKDVWETGIPGIGIQMTSLTDVDDRNGVMSSSVPGSYNYFVDYVKTNFGGKDNAKPSSGDFMFKYQLYVTGPVKQSTITSITLGTLGSNDVVSNPTMTPAVTLKMSIPKIVPTTCSVTSSTINVTLPTVNTNLLSPVGKTAGDTTFSIGLSCQAGANVYITLTDANDATNVTSNLKLTSDSTATGVALRLLNSSGLPVSYGPNSPVAGNTNQWLVGASEGLTSIPLTAQYISTGTMGPGVVKANATFMMSYQ